MPGQLQHVLVVAVRIELLPALVGLLRDTSRPPRRDETEPITFNCIMQQILIRGR